MQSVIFLIGIDCLGQLINRWSGAVGAFSSDLG